MLCPGNLESETASGQIVDKSGLLSSEKHHWNSVLLVVDSGQRLFAERAVADPEGIEGIHGVRLNPLPTNLNIL